MGEKLRANILIVNVGLPTTPSDKSKDPNFNALRWRLENGPEKITLEKGVPSAEKVYLVATKETKIFANELRKNLVPSEKDCEIVKVDPDDIDKIRGKIEAIDGLKNNKKKIFDITAGTKAMVVGTVAAAFNFENAFLIYETGQRGPNGVVCKNEYPVKATLSEPKRLLLIKEFFEAQNYAACLNLLRKKNSPKDKMLKCLIQAFNEWDRFNHAVAIETFGRFFNNFKMQVHKMSMNQLQFLKVTVNEHNAS